MNPYAGAAETEATEEAATQTEADLRHPEATKVESQTQARRVLVVDDDERFRERLVRAMKRRGHQVWSASNGEEARSVLAMQPIDWAVVDLRLPGEWGLHIVRDLLQDKVRDKVRDTSRNKVRETPRNKVQGGVLDRPRDLAPDTLHDPTQHPASTTDSAFEGSDLEGSDLEGMRLDATAKLAGKAPAKRPYPRIRIVVLTAYGSIATALEAMRLGATGFLQKPASVDEIEAALCESSIEDAPSAEVPSLARAEWEHINRVLTECDGNVCKAATMLGIHRRTLQRKLAKFPVSR